jgi:hypothetical protein
MTETAAGPNRVPLYRNLDYVFLVGAQALSITGREIESLVLPLLVLALTGSPVQAGLIGAVQTVPYLLLSLPAGALVDRWNRKHVLIACEAIRVAAFASLPIVWVFGNLGLTQLYVVSAVAGSAFVFYNIAEISSLPQLVAREELPRATSVNIVVEWAGENAGPALGGALTTLGRTTVVGAMLAYATQAVILLVSTVLLGGIRRPTRVERSIDAPKKLIAEIGAGARWLFTQPVLRLMTLRGLATSFVFSPISLVLIVRARDGFHASPFLIGVMFSLGGVMGLVMTVIAPSLNSRVRVGIVLVVAGWIWAVGLVAVASAQSMAALMLAWLVMPAVAGIQELTGLSYRLSLIPPDMQGRVNSVVRFVVFGARPASLALGGYLIGSLGAPHTLWLLAACMALTALASVPLWSAR